MFVKHLHRRGHNHLEYGDGEVAKKQKRNYPIIRCQQVPIEAPSLLINGRLLFRDTCQRHVNDNAIHAIHHGIEESAF